MGREESRYRIGVEGFQERYLSLLVERFEPMLVLAFGSRARGDHLRGSDLDLVVVSDAFEDVPFPNRASEVMEALGMIEAVDLLCYTPEEFERKRGQIGIVRIADREGIRMYEDSGKRSAKPT